MNILLLDIETAPNLVHVWGLWQQNVGLPQILDAGYVMCWSAKWYGKDEVLFDSLYHNTQHNMLKRIWSLLDEADIVIHYNGSKFDIPTLNKEFITHGFTPPSPYKQIDLLSTARNQFKFPSNKLDYIAKALGLGQKVGHRGHQLWIDCMARDGKAWNEMKEYNIHDVILLEKVYEVFKPWVKPHPNVTLYTDNNDVICPVCGGNHYTRRGYAFTTVGKYQRYKCKDCGGWFKDRKNLGYKQTLQA